MAERTGLEPATPGVTGRYSNQLNYRSALVRPKSKLKAWRCSTLTWGNPTLPSTLFRFTSEFGMDSGGSKRYGRQANSVFVFTFSKKVKAKNLESCLCSLHIQCSYIESIKTLWVLYG